jgi:hypothetical protein
MEATQDRWKWVWIAVVFILLVSFARGCVEGRIDAQLNSAEGQHLLRKEYERRLMQEDMP